MDILEKLKILSDAAKYDVSCSSSGSNRKNTPGGLGNGHMSGICHSWSNDGRCISLLKILLSNKCIYDCAYCVNRASNNTLRAEFTPAEVADLTINFYKRNYIEGLFLSSAVSVSPDHTMEMLLKTVQILRTQYNFNGYIHLKAIPGADSRLIYQAGLLSDRMSVNIELPSSRGLKLLAPQKDKESILRPMGFISSQLAETSQYGNSKGSSGFLPAGQTTQLIVGATGDSDLSILKLSEGLYSRFGLKRVYYSAYVPVSDNPNLPSLSAPPLLREHRLYQADWLLRFYGFTAGELVDSANPQLDTELDPKSIWALNNLSLFPVEINTVDYNMLLRVPGIGVKCARRIAAARRTACLSYEHLKKFGVVLKRARHFITCSGKYYGERQMDEMHIRPQLLTGSVKTYASPSYMQQLSIFSLLNDRTSAVTGEL